MKQRNQAPIFSGESSYFEPPKEVSSANQNSDKSITLGQAEEDFELRGKVEGRADKTLQQYGYVFGRFTQSFSKEREVGLYSLSINVKILPISKLVLSSLLPVK